MSLDDTPHVGGAFGGKTVTFPDDSSSVPRENHGMKSFQGRPLEGDQSKLLEENRALTRDLQARIARSHRYG